MRTINYCSIVALLTLTACGQDRPRIVLPPVELTTCAEEPAPPSLPARDGTTETLDVRDVATLGYVLDLRAAWGDCASRVAGLAAWREAAGR